MRPNPHSSTPSTALPTTHCSYFPVQNPQRKSSASQERLPSTTSQIDYQALNMHIGLYNKPTQYDFKLAEASHANPAPTSAQRYNYQSQDHQVLMRKSSASPTPYEVHIETRRGSAQVQSIQNQLQTSQSSNNVQWKAESKQPDFLFTFKKDAQNQFFNLSDVSSVHYASAEQPDTVVTKMFSAESRKGKLEPQQENTETTLNLPGSDFKSNKLTEPANKPKIAVDTPTKLIACLEMLDTPSTPPKREKKSQAATDYFSNPSQQNYMESPELLRQQSRERISKPAVNVNNQVKPPSLGSEVNPFGFESVGKEYESKNSIGNPSYCTQSPSIKYQSHHPVRNNFAMETKNYDKEIEINPGSVNAFMSQGPELKKSSEHNYYSYLSLITVHSSEDQGKEYRSAGKRSASSQKQMNSSQELAMQNVKNSPGKSKQGEKTSQISLRNVLKPNVSVSDFESTENKKRVSHGDTVQNEDTKNYESVADSASTQKKSSPVRNIRESKSLEKYCSVGSNIQSSVSGIDTDSKESTDQWLFSANERARQILNRLPQKSSLSPPLMAVTRQQSDNKNFDSLKKEEESKVEVTSQAETGVKKSLLKACGMKVKSTGNVQIKISDLIAQSNNEPQVTTSDKDKEKEAEKPAKINLTSCPQPASLTFGEDLSGERSSKTSDSLRPAFFKEKILESSVLDKEKEKKQGVPTMKMPTRTNSHESIKDYRRGSINSNITKGNGNLDTSDMQYSESQGSSNNMVCIGSRVVTKEGESRQVTEESPFAGGKEVFPIIVSQRQCENKEEMRGSVKQENDVEEKRTYLCSSLKENEFAVPNQQVAANTSDLEELQKSLMSKIEGIHSDIIEKINKISDKIDLEMSHCGPVHMDGTASPYMNHSFSEMPSHYLPQAKNVEVKQHYNNNSIFIEGSNQRQTDNTTSSEIYEYDSQSRTYSIRPPLPLQASNINKQPSEAKPFLAYSQRSGVNMENPFSNRSSNFPISRDRQYSNCNSVTTSNNVSICLEQLALESQEKRNAGTTRESLHQRPPKPSENRFVQQNISTSLYGKVQKSDIKTKVASVIPRDLPKPLSTKSQNKPSYSKPELYAQYSSQTDISDRFKKNNGFSHSGASQKGLMDKGGLNLSVKSFSEKKESLESELNRSWGTNVRLSAKRHSVGPKEDAPPIESSPLEKVTRSSMSSHNPEKMMVLFNSSPIVHDKEGEQRGEQRKAYWIMSPDFSFPGSRDSSRQLESGGSTHHSLGQVHSVNHEMQRLEKKLEKYLKAGNSFESLEPIREMSNSETYYNQGLGSRNSSVNKIDGNVSQMKKSEGTQSVKMINRWNVKEKEVMSNRGGNYGQTLRGDKKNTASSGSFRKERPDREETSGERVRGGSREGSQGKGYGAQMLNKKVKGMLHENSVKGVARKSFYY